MVWIGLLIAFIVVLFAISNGMVWLAIILSIGVLLILLPKAHVESPKLEEYERKYETDLNLPPPTYPSWGEIKSLLTEAGQVSGDLANRVVGADLFLTGWMKKVAAGYGKANWFSFSNPYSGMKRIGGDYPDGRFMDENEWKVKMLKELNEMKKQGAITEEEFEKMKKKLNLT